MQFRSYMSAGVICTLGAGEHARLIEISSRQLERWVGTFDYHLDVQYETLSAERPPAWSKVLQIRENLDSHKYVFWIDADTVVWDTNHDFRDLVSWRKPLALVAHNYHNQWFPNLGVIAIQSTRFTRRLFDRLWEMDEYTNHKWWENAAFLDLLGISPTQEPLKQTHKDLIGHKIKWLDNSWNSMGLDPSPAPKILHYPGVSNPERERLMTEMMSKIE